MELGTRESLVGRFVVDRYAKWALSGAHMTILDASNRSVVVMSWRHTFRRFSSSWRVKLRNWPSTSVLHGDFTGQVIALAGRTDACQPRLQARGKLACDVRGYHGK
eukprot:4106962-Amphidinium_carterae.1